MIHRVGSPLIKSEQIFHCMHTPYFFNSCVGGYFNYFHTFNVVNSECCFGYRSRVAFFSFEQNWSWQEKCYRGSEKLKSNEYLFISYWRRGSFSICSSKLWLQLETKCCALKQFHRLYVILKVYLKYYLKEKEHKEAFLKSASTLIVVVLVKFL